MKAWGKSAAAAGLTWLSWSRAGAGDLVSLREAAKGKFLIGTAIQSEHLDDPRHAELIGSQFSCLTPGNEMKPDALQREEGRFTFERGDKIADFAKAHGQETIGHTLLWHQQSPAWLFQDADGKPLSREKALAHLRDHIRAVLSHYKGRVKGWDVVNEAVNDGPESDLRDTPARKAIGDDFVLKAFEFAHEADPAVELYYNDYNIDMDYKRDKALRLVRALRKAGLRLDAVGIQGHWMLESPKLEEIERGIQAYEDEGLKVMITEMDVDVLPRKGAGGADLSAAEKEGMDPYKAGLPPEVQEKLARRYQTLFGLFRKHPKITRVTLWGTTDANSWLNNFPVPGRTNYPMLWNRDYSPKPALAAVLQALR